MKVDIGQMLPAAELNLKVSTLMEAMVPLLEAAAKITPENQDVGRKQELLTQVRQTIGTQILSTAMNGSSTRTGSTESSYYFVMGMKYWV